VRRVLARRDERLVARIVRRLPMRYAAGADATIDRPAHVRAASGLAWVGPAHGRIAVIQDDANFVALVDPATGDAEAIVLPSGQAGLRQFDDARGNKAHKLDLEALATVVDGTSTLLLAFGSGSSARRESVLVLEDAERDSPTARIVHVPRLYAALRAHAAFAGSELNVEGALQVGDRVRLFQRGNGAAIGGVAPVDATCDLPLRALLAHLATPDAIDPPAPRDVVQYELGDLHGTRLSFTDAALAREPRGAGSARAILYVASAEDSPDAVRDGDVAGSAVGVIEERDGVTSARWAELCDDDGPVALKVEGIALHPTAPDRAWVVVDVDAHDRPSELCEVVLEGGWPG
jgi:hypothetical protein